MASSDNTVFISYRRGASKLFARSLFLDLTHRGFEPFLDVETIGPGEFQSVILTEIAARPHFLVLISPGSLERCSAEGDWLRHEYEEAKRLRRNIIPLVEEGQSVDCLNELLPPSMSGLFAYNAVTFHHDLWSGCMEKLCAFLKPVNVTLQARSPAQRVAVERKIAAASSADRDTNTVGMSFAALQPGVFWMGSPEDELGRSEYEKRHLVKLTRPFQMAVTPVTQGQWRTVMGTSLWTQARKMLEDDTKYNFWASHGEKTIRDFYGLQRDSGKDGVIGIEADDYPMYFVNWHEAVEFCRHLTEMERLGGALPPGYEYRLPTEAEWEYACRARTGTATYAGDLEIRGVYHAPELDAIAWYGGNSSVGYKGRGWDTSGLKEKQYPGGIAGPRQVGTKAPNAWGLFDMIGNVWEWCADWYGPYPDRSGTDPAGPKQASNRVYRGGSWGDDAGGCRSASRHRDSPLFRFYDLGFRPVLTLASK
jgi:formylglycine-generating enzyme required for sulfatase activity